MQQQSNMQNKFLIDADIGDDDVTLPNLPAVDVPIIDEPAVKAQLRRQLRLQLVSQLKHKLLKKLKQVVFLVE